MKHSDGSIVFSSPRMSWKLCLFRFANWTFAEYDFSSDASIKTFGHLRDSTTEEEKWSSFFLVYAPHRSDARFIWAMVMWHGRRRRVSFKVSEAWDNVQLSVTRVETGMEVTHVLVPALLWLQFIWLFFQSLFIFSRQSLEHRTFSNTLIKAILNHIQLAFNLENKSKNISLASSLQKWNKLSIKKKNQTKKFWTWARFRFEGERIEKVPYIIFIRFYQCDSLFPFPLLYFIHKIRVSFQRTLIVARKCLLGVKSVKAISTQLIVGINFTSLGFNIAPFAHVSIMIHLANTRISGHDDRDKNSFEYPSLEKMCEWHLFRVVDKRGLVMNL